MATLEPLPAATELSVARRSSRSLTSTAAAAVDGLPSNAQGDFRPLANSNSGGGGREIRLPRRLGSVWEFIREQTFGGGGGESKDALERAKDLYLAKTAAATLNSAAMFALRQVQSCAAARAAFFSAGRRRRHSPCVCR